MHHLGNERRRVNQINVSEKAWMEIKANGWKLKYKSYSNIALTGDTM
jgi:hypothetical protein